MSIPCDHPLDERLPVVGDALIAGLRVLAEDLHVRAVSSGSVMTLTSTRCFIVTRAVRHLRGLRAIAQAPNVVAIDASIAAASMSPTAIDRHALGAVPGVVERAQTRDGRVADDVGLADRQAVGVARPIEEDRDLLVADARAGAEPAAPLFDDDAALLFHFRRIERQAAGEIRERRQALATTSP